MKRKCLAVGIILLFIGTCIIPSATSQQPLSRNIITVDDEPGLADYTSIRDALNHRILAILSKSIVECTMKTLLISQQEI